MAEEKEEERAVRTEYPEWYFDQKKSAYWFYYRDSNAYYLYAPTSSSSPKEEEEDEEAWPLWHYDEGRSVYWYLCRQENAYYMYQEETIPHVGSGQDTHIPHDDGGKLDSLVDAAAPHPQRVDYGASHEWQLDPYITHNRHYHVDSHEQSLSTADVSSSSCPAEEKQPTLPSGWVEDFLIEWYLGGSSGTLSSGDSPSLPFHDTPKTENDGMVCQENEFCAELPFSGSCAVDIETRVGSEKFTCHQEEVLYSEAVQQENESDCLYNVDNTEGSQTEEDIDEDKREMELWQAQYGQVVRNDAQGQSFPRAINLWNWTTAVQKVKSGKKSSISLVGQLASIPSRLHPSLQHRNGFIKTSCICEVNLDLVKVSSGELYRLRQPNSKYLTSVSMYDSSNPTKDWDFPCIHLSVLEDFESHTEDVSNAALKPSHDSLVAKPFVPNLNHQRYHHLNKRKAATPSIPAGIRVLTDKEIASVEERRQKYRDRAKERRELHGKYGVGVGYGLYRNGQELYSSAKDMDNECEKASARHPAAKHMLEKMGWREGESLGKRKDGLVEPLQGMSNNGRVGIGWISSSSDHKLVKVRTNPLYETFIKRTSNQHM